MSYRKLFYILNIALVVVFAWAYYRDYNAEWKPYQRQYLKLAAAELDQQATTAAPDEAKRLKAQANALRHQPLEVKQIIAKDLGRVDRCITCHVGMDEYTNPSMTNALTSNPYKAHPQLDPLFKNHPFQKYGCTVCHAGQGLATTVSDAHGKVHNWEQPMLEGVLIQASCVRCHANFDHLKGAEFAARGKRLFYQHGCIGCHSIRGVGGVISVDLGDVADKPLERIAGYNFSLIKKDGKPLPEDEWILQNWILAHLTNDTNVFVPNDPHAKFNAEPIAPSGMPNFTEPDATGVRELSQEDAHAIAAWLMSMTAEQMPNNYYVHEAPPREPVFSNPLAHGQHVFEKYGCAGCHGLHGTKGRRNFNALGPGQSDPDKDMGLGREPTLVDVVGTYTHEELMKKIASGVPPTAINKFNPRGPTPPLYMPAWKDKIKGKELDDLATWLLSIAKKDNSGF